MSVVRLSDFDVEFGGRVNLVPKLMCPAWRAPIVGTRPMESPCSRTFRLQVRNSEMVRRTSMPLLQGVFEQDKVP